MSWAALSLKEGNTRKYCGEITVKAVWSFVKNRITFVLWIISISLDPYICYVPSIDDEKKLLNINSSLLITIWVLYCSLLIYRISISLSEYKGKLGKWQIFNMAESFALIFSNVLQYSLVLIPKMEIRTPVFSVVLGIFLAVYLMRVIGIYRLYSEEVIRSTAIKLAEAPLRWRTSSKLAEAPLIKIGFNLLLFVYGGHIFGGLWYLLAVWKKLSCWRNVCLEHDHAQICHYANNRFNVNPEGNKLLSDTCFAEIEDTYELGIFKDAFESRIVEETSNLWKKVFYCFRWGIQNISGFGTNLQVSTYIWENIFVVLIAIYGVGTFTLFIGNMQNLIKSAINERTEEKRKEYILKKHHAIRLRQEQLQQWVLFRKLSENLQNIITEYQQYNYHLTGVVDVQNLFITLPKDVENNIKRELCLELIKKVERFRRLCDTSLLDLCDCVKPVVYAMGTRIVREGYPINEMLFVLKGMLWNFSSTASSTNNVPPPHDRRKIILNAGDFWGEELVNWLQDKSSSSSSSNKLISQTTIQALSKVEAFVLRVDDLENLYNEKAKILQSWLRKRRIEISERNAQEKTPPPPRDQLIGPEIV